MAIDFLEIKIRRRLLLAAIAVLPVACITSQPYPVSSLIYEPFVKPALRLPRVGQQWVYVVRNVFNQEVVDVITEQIVYVGDQVIIQRSGAKLGSLPDEIQEPWGYVLQDPHWSPSQKFLTKIPLWPEQLNPGWSGFYRSRYQVLGYPDSDFYWGLNIDAIAWEQVKSAAGNFLVLKYTIDIPYFQSNDPFRIVNTRNEDVWFSPDIGRWVYRRGYGRYLTPGLRWSEAYWEDYLEWELLSWN